MNTVREAKIAACSAAVSSVFPSPWESTECGTKAARTLRGDTAHTHLRPRILGVENAQVVVERGARPVWDTRSRALGASTAERPARGAAHERDALIHGICLSRQRQSPTRRRHCIAVYERGALHPRRDRCRRIGCKGAINDPCNRSVRRYVLKGGAKRGSEGEHRTTKTALVHLEIHRRGAIRADRYTTRNARKRRVKKCCGAGAVLRWRKGGV